MKAIDRRNTSSQSLNPPSARAFILAGFLFCASGALAQPTYPGGDGSYISYPPLNSWSFNDTTNWTSDNGHTPVSFTNVSSVTFFGDGTPLVLNSTDPAWLQYNLMEADGTTNLTVDVGSVAFWFAPAWAGTNNGGSGPGQWGRLIEVGGYTSDASFGWWSLYVDDVGANLYFTVQPGDSSTTTYLTAPISWTSNYWHLVALTYSATNTALYLDGVLAATGTGVTSWPGTNVLAGGFFIGSDSNGVNQAQGAFDDLYTYNIPLDTNSVYYGNYGTVWADYYLLPWNLPASIASAPSSPQVTPSFVAITGSGYLQTIGTLTNCVTNSAVWMSNVVATSQTNGAVNVAFSILGGSNGLPYDVFATGGLVSTSITNSQWGWMGQVYQCTRYLLTNLPPTSALLILGPPLDSDGDGLTDAYEVLVSHTDPYKADTSGDGMPDGWKVLWGLNPVLNNPAQPGTRANYGYNLTDWLSTVSGVRSGAATSDPEGNVQQASQ